MQLNKQTAISLLIITELSVELMADALESILGSFPWMSWWLITLDYHVPEFVLCYMLMAIIIASMVMIEPKNIENMFRFIVDKILQTFLIIKSQLKFKKKVKY